MLHSESDDQEIYQKIREDGHVFIGMHAKKVKVEVQHCSAY